MFSGEVTWKFFRLCFSLVVFVADALFVNLVFVAMSLNKAQTLCVCRFMHDRWSQDATPTVGAAFASKDVMVDKKKVTLGIWGVFPCSLGVLVFICSLLFILLSYRAMTDTAGAERYESMARHYYKGPSCSLLLLPLFCFVSVC